MSQQLHSKTALINIVLSLFIAVAAHAQVTAVITADNAYGFGYGTKYGIAATQYYGGIENLKAADISSAATGAEIYVITPAITDYLYIIAWSDDNVHQGVLGQFKNGSLPPIFTGVGNWQVFATGIDFDPQPKGTPPPLGPTLALINQQIAAANITAGGAGSSKGWRGLALTTQGLALGPLNDGTNGIFGAVSGIDSTARWMWFNSDPNVFFNGTYEAFTKNPGMGGHKEFLIFRIPAKDIVTPAAFSATTVCQGAATSFKDLSAGGTVTSWHWDLGDGTTATDQNLTHTYMTAGTYTVELCINGGTSCTTKSVKVNPLPPALAIHGPTSKCNLGPNTPYSVKNLGYTYSWSVSNGTITSPTTGNSVTVTWKPTGASILTVMITSSSGCSTTSSILVTPCTSTTTSALPAGETASRSLEQ